MVFSILIIVGFQVLGSNIEKANNAKKQNREFSEQEMKQKFEEVEKIMKNYKGKRGEQDKMELYIKFIENYPDSHYTPRAIRELIISGNRLPKKYRAERFSKFRQMRKNESNKNKDILLQLLIGIAYMEEESVDSQKRAIKELQKIIKNYPESEYTDDAQLYIGYCYFDLGDYNKAIEEYKKVIDNYPDSGAIPETLYCLPQCYANFKDRENYRKYLEILADKYPYDEFGKSAKEMLEKYCK